MEQTDESQPNAPGTQQSAQRSQAPLPPQHAVRAEESPSAHEPQSAHTPVRRRFLQLLGSGLVVGLAGCSGNPGGTTPKAKVNYQDHPKRGQQCSGCQFFQPPDKGDKFGTCEKVKGNIAPYGWCQLYTPK